MRKIKIIDKQNRKFDGIIKLCPKMGENYNCYFILTHNRSFDGQIAKRKENYEYSWCLETEHSAKEKKLDLKTLKNFDDYDWSYALPTSNNYKIIFIDNSSFEDIEL